MAFPGVHLVHESLLEFYDENYGSGKFLNYTGCSVNGTAHGNGKAYITNHYKDEIYFEGEWKNGKVHGFAVQENLSTGYRHEGTH